MIDMTIRNTAKITETMELLQKYNSSAVTIKQHLSAQKDRFAEFSRSFDGLLVDFSRTTIDAECFDSLLQLVESCGIDAMRDRMYGGERINFTENRAVLHPVWRERNFSDLLPKQEADMLSAATVRLREIAEALHQGHLPGEAGQGRIRHLVHIGIGGSLLGPRLLCEAFPPSGNCPQVHFLSSVDALERERLLKQIDPRETAVMLVSKSFTTSEVLAHARRIRQWQSESLNGEESDQRLFAVTAEAEKAEQFGVPAGHVLQMGTWTGGRFSVWSPVGVTAAITMGADAFEQFLAGGASMDRHFRETPLRDNLPVILALLSVWHRNICSYDVHGLVPYDGRLKGLPGWLQQVEMESNGKSVDTAGQPVSMDTSPVVMGDTGTDAQHALFQAFHQGTCVVPLDFIGVVKPDHNDLEAQQALLSHMLAQSTALAVGRNSEQAAAMMRDQGVAEEDLAALLPHRVMPGNRPSIVILLDELSPAILGRLLALYEHKVFVESIIWQINAFDQWGVELGKSLADAIQPALADESNNLPGDIPGLEGLVNHIRKQNPEIQ
jgi:glucose-6-phosphate isomerase